MPDPNRDVATADIGARSSADAGGPTERGDNRPCLPTVIDPTAQPLTAYRRPNRPGPTDRFEPGDALIRTCIDNERFHVGIWTALPGESFWTDIHDADEFLYVIAGEATILVPPLATAVMAIAGSVVYMPCGTPHQTMNRSDTVLRVLFCAPPNSIAMA